MPIKKSEITYRIAGIPDVEVVAQMHALSWQRHYKGIFTDRYLKSEVESDRMTIWKKRFSQPNSNQYIILAESGGQSCGFACTYLNDHEKWGALLDNLHVMDEFMYRGIGRALMNQSARWVWSQNSSTTLYLLVLSQNKDAIQFYNRIGGQVVEELIYPLPGGGEAPVLRYLWKNDGTLG